MSAVSEDGLALLVNRIEALAIKGAKATELELLNRNLSQDNRRLRADFEAAEEKIGEWAEYAKHLRGVIDQLAIGRSKQRRVVLPNPPKRLETEIPF